MAKLCIYNEIVDEETKVMYQDWCGTDGVCYKDIHSFLEAMKDDDDVIDIRLHCPGGDCIEGWAIYDALRNSGKTISATIEGECSSMATIVLLAAPKERRFGFANSRLCIHNPAVAWLDLCTMERLTADELDNLKGKLDVQKQALIEEQTKILNLYVERTGADRGELQALMNEDKYVDMDKAIELGFISSTVAPNTASKKTHHKTSSKMKETKVKDNVLKKLLALAGFGKIEDAEAAILCQKITAADGSEFTVEREDGDPQVGDKAYPNGTYTLDDGTVIVVTDEVIESITPAGGGEDDDDEDLKALQEQVNTLTTQVETLTSEKQALADEKATLESEKATLEQPTSPTRRPLWRLRSRLSPRLRRPRKRPQSLTSWLRLVARIGWRMYARCSPLSILATVPLSRSRVVVTRERPRPRRCSVSSVRHRRPNVRLVSNH